jgi:NAD(P)-dependent dehydrogenase (short-subunit alcohol dehydrogenase family)
MRLEGASAIVTAGGGGIGQGTAWLMAEQGCKVLAVDIDESGLAETLAQAKAPERIRTLRADATSQAGAEASVAAALEAFGGVNHLVNVVGGSRPGQTVVDISLDEWEGWVRLNLTSAFLMCKAAIPQMAASGGGAIINVSSGAAVTGMMKNPAYVAAKGGMISLTRSLAIDHADQKIRANCVAPGAILTPLMRRNRRPEEIDYLGKMTLAGRIGEPHDIAATIAFLCSRDGEFINGELINVAGGRRGGV